jgi:hypothetical protein
LINAYIANHDAIEGYKIEIFMIFGCFFINGIICFKVDKCGAFDDMKQTAIQERDKAMQYLVEKHSGKKRHESLLQTHQKEAKRKREVRSNVKTEACLVLRLVCKLNDFIFCFTFTRAKVALNGWPTGWTRHIA